MKLIFIIFALTLIQRANIIIRLRTYIVEAMCSAGRFATMDLISGSHGGE
jgi:hypothetical protein